MSEILGTYGTKFVVVDTEEKTWRYIKPADLKEEKRIAAQIEARELKYAEKT